MPSYTSSLRNARMNQLVTDLATLPILSIYSSSAGSIPTGASVTASSLNILLAQIAITSSNFAPTASSGLLTANAFTTESAAPGTGTATYARLGTSTGSLEAQFTAGSSVGNECVLNTASISSGAQVAVTSFTILEGNT